MSPATENAKRYFTVDEANRMLPLVRAIVEDIVQLFREVHERRDRLSRVRQLPGSVRRSENDVYQQELDDIEQEINEDIKRLEGYVDELRQLGVEFKDPVKGLVDFLHVMDDREVYLCWMLGEEEVAHWHDLEAGFRGRQSLLEGSILGDDDSLAES